MADASVPGPTWAAVLEELARDLVRVTDRLRNLSRVRLESAVPGHPSRAEAARAVAQRLADAAASLEAAGEHPRTRAVPALEPLSVGDQVAVTGHDLLAAAAMREPHDPAWSRHDRRTALEVVGEAAGELAELRRKL